MLGRLKIKRVLGEKILKILLKKRVFLKRRCPSGAPFKTSRLIQGPHVIERATA
jgi:hypothetical protein